MSGGRDQRRAPDERPAEKLAAGGAADAAREPLHVRAAAEAVGEAVDRLVCGARRHGLSEGEDVEEERGEEAHEPDAGAEAD